MDLALFSLPQWYALSISVYLVLALFRKERNGKKFLGVAAFFVVIILSLFAARRTGIGDTTTYISYYERTPDSLAEFMNQFVFQGEWGFNVFLFLIKRIFGYNVFAFLFICSLIIIGGLNAFWKEQSPYLELCILIYIFGGSFVVAMNGVRQSIVASIFIANYRLIKERKYISYIIICMLLSTIHQSSIILLPMILILNFKPWGKGSWGLLIASVVIYLGYPLFAELVTTLLASSNYDIYSNGILYFENGGANILRVAVLLVPIILAYMYRRELAVRFPSYGICLNGAILSFMFMLIASVKSWIFARLCIYFTPFQLHCLHKQLSAQAETEC